MEDEDKKLIVDFLNIKKRKFADLVELLLNKLSQQIDFNVKIQKASIQLINKGAFAVLGFRKNMDSFFVEFYNAKQIENDRIAQMKRLNDSLIIHTVNISNSSEIDNMLISWIKQSDKLISAVKKE